MSGWGRAQKKDRDKNNCYCPTPSNLSENHTPPKNKIHIKLAQDAKHTYQHTHIMYFVWVTKVYCRERAQNNFTSKKHSPCHKHTLLSEGQPHLQSKYNFHTLRQLLKNKIKLPKYLFCLLRQVQVGKGLFWEERLGKKITGLVTHTPSSLKATPFTHQNQFITLAGSPHT